MLTLVSYGDSGGRAVNFLRIAGYLTLSSRNLLSIAALKLQWVTKTWCSFWYWWEELGADFQYPLPEASKLLPVDVEDPKYTPTRPVREISSEDAKEGSSFNRIDSNLDWLTEAVGSQASFSLIYPNLFIRLEHGLGVGEIHCVPNQYLILICTQLTILEGSNRRLLIYPAKFLRWAILMFRSWENNVRPSTKYWFSPNKWVKKTRARIIMLRDWMRSSGIETALGIKRDYISLIEGADWSV